MQINNWADLLKNKRLAKTPRDLDNDLVIIGTNTQGNLKKQDTWQPYAMTLADLASAIGGGGGGVSFQLLADGYTEIFEKEEGSPNYFQKNSAFTPAENSIIKISTVSIPNGLNWRGTWNVATAKYAYNDVVSVVDPDDNNLYYTYWMKNDSGGFVPAGYALPYTTSDASNLYWAQLGVQGPKGTDGYRTAVLTLYKWVNSSTVPTTELPSGTSDYDWITGTFTPPTTPESWSQTIGAPTPGWYLYKISKIITNNDTTTPETVTWGTETPEYLSYAGANAGAIIDVSTAAKSASYTVQTTDGGKLITFDTAASALEITVPNLAGMPNGSQVMFVWNSGSPGGTLKFVDSSTTLTSANSMLFFRAIGSSATLVKLTNTTFYIAGDLAPY